MTKAVCDFLSFDRRLAGVPIAFQPTEHLPARELVPDRLNELLLSLVQTSALNASKLTPPGGVRVQTLARGDEVVVRVGCAKATEGEVEPRDVDDPAWAPQRRMAQALGGRLLVEPTAVQLVLPPPWG
jgi:hypothetical protein